MCVCVCESLSVQCSYLQVYIWLRVTQLHNGIECPVCLAGVIEMGRDSC